MKTVVDSPWETRQLPSSSLWVSCRANSLFVMLIVWCKWHFVEKGSHSRRFSRDSKSWNLDHLSQNSIALFNLFEFSRSNFISLNFFFLVLHHAFIVSRTLEIEWCCISNACGNSFETNQRRRQRNLYGICLFKHAQQSENSQWIIYFGTGFNSFSCRNASVGVWHHDKLCLSLFSPS